MCNNWDFLIKEHLAQLIENNCYIENAGKKTDFIAIGTLAKIIIYFILISFFFLSLLFFSYYLFLSVKKRR